MESKIQSKILRYLESSGFYVVKIIRANRDGVPDIVASVRGRFVAFEVKRPGEKPSELQKYNIDEIERAGGLAFVVESREEVEDIIQWI